MRIDAIKSKKQLKEFRLISLFADDGMKIGHVNIGVALLFTGNFQWCLDSTQSILIAIKNSVKSIASWLVFVGNYENATLNINKP